MATKSGSKNPGALTDPVATAGASVAPEPSPGEPVEAQRKPWPVRLYLGEIGYNFIGNRRVWYAISGALILICLGSMIFKQFNLGVEFAGGERFRTPGTEQQLEEVSQAVEDAGAAVTSAQVVGDEQLVIITADLSEEQGREVTAAIADAIGVDTTDVANSTTSASWGRDVTGKAVQGLLVFLVLVLVFLAVRFQWKMAAGAMVALFHDLMITAGVYSLVGFEVTPASVIGFLTILGFSLYDTVVVFDKVDENAKGLLASQRRTYSESANLAINQVLMRSINTSIFALLPVLGLLYAGVFLIGEGTLQDLALVLFVGMLAGVYSSIFLAAPVLCDLKEREPEYQKLAKRLKAKRAAAGVGSGGFRTTSTGDMTLSPAAGARADRSRRKRPADQVPVEDDSDAGTDAAIAAIYRTASSRAAAEPEDAGPGGSGNVVASARRTRPRSNRTVSSAKTTSVSSSSAEGSPAKTDTAQASTPPKSPAGTNSARQSGRRAGPAKRGR